MNEFIRKRTKSCPVFMEKHYAYEFLAEFCSFFFAATISFHISGSFKSPLIHTDHYRVRRDLNRNNKPSKWTNEGENWGVGRMTEKAKKKNATIESVCEKKKLKFNIISILFLFLFCTWNYTCHCRIRIMHAIYFHEHFTHLLAPFSFHLFNFICRFANCELKNNAVPFCSWFDCCIVCTMYIVQRTVHIVQSLINNLSAPSFFCNWFNFMLMLNSIMVG